jgi:alanine dehydrogenase
MKLPKTVGLPRMMKEAGEKRVFLPEFVQYLTTLDCSVYVEEGYGSRSGFAFEDYQMANPDVHSCSREEAFQQDVILILRSPTLEEYKLIRHGSCLVSMLHFPTRPTRVKRLKELGINAISLDSIANDNNIRLVENMKAVGWNGLEAAFDVLEKRWVNMMQSEDMLIHVLVLGAGMVGKHAVEAATKLGNIERFNQYLRTRRLGVITQTVGRNVTGQHVVMESLLRQADILVDAAQRWDASVPIIPNQWLEWLPEHAVIADLAVDPYLLEASPPVVRGVEGIPQGNLDQYIFSADDPAWDQTVPVSIPSKNRRSVVSCYSWPGIHPEACMRHYIQQLEPLMEVLFSKGYQQLSLEGSYFERALYRGKLHTWLQHEHYTLQPHK